MRAEIVSSTGSELLLGQIANATLIPRHLPDIGLDLFHKITVGDNLARVADAPSTALGRADVVITTGGLGPAADAVAREAAAQATGREVVLDAAEADGPNPVLPARIGVVAAGPVVQCDYRFDGDLRQARVRACVMPLDLWRRVFQARSG